MRKLREAEVALAQGDSVAKVARRLSIARTLELENSIARTRALAHLVSVAARVQETSEFEARLRALEAGVWREAPDAGP